jgi:hypothetical protein
MIRPVANTRRPVSEASGNAIAATTTACTKAAPTPGARSPSWVNTSPMPGALNAIPTNMISSGPPNITKMAVTSAANLASA